MSSGMKNKQLRLTNITQAKIAHIRQHIMQATKQMANKTA